MKNIVTIFKIGYVKDKDWYQINIYNGNNVQTYYYDTYMGIYNKKIKELCEKYDINFKVIGVLNNKITDKNQLEFLNFRSKLIKKLIDDNIHPINWYYYI